MALRKKKAFVSKTAAVSAQVSAYGSKNNSQNSSLARGGVGAGQNNSKQLPHHELGTSIQTLKPGSIGSHASATKPKN